MQSKNCARSGEIILKSAERVWQENCTRFKALKNDRYIYISDNYGKSGAFRYLVPQELAYFCGGNYLIPPNVGPNDPEIDTW